MKTSPIAVEGRLDERSKELRRVIVRMVVAAGRGHLSSALSIVEILRVLYDDILHYNPADPKLPDRDRFILSKGHGCLALYAILADKGFFPKEELLKFCSKDSILGGHPEYGKVPGVEASTGSLGHGLSIGIGFALNAKHEKKNYRTFVLIGDGESDEGSIWEAALCASKHKLSNLIVVVDCNKKQSYDTTFNVLNLEPLVDKWRSFGFITAEADGHDVEQLKAVFAKAPLHPAKPSLIICHTVKGKGIDFVERDLKWHHKSNIPKEEIQALLSAL